MIGLEYFTIQHLKFDIKVTQKAAHNKSIVAIGA